MDPTIKLAIVHVLEDLSEINFQKFCHQLRDRREEPRVRLRAVEGKTVCQIADLLVSTFTKIKAPEVAVEILKQINCHEEAETLYSKTKACVDRGDPIFPKTSTGELETNPSEEARKQAAGQRILRATRSGVKKPEEVKAEAKARVISEGGDPSNDWLILSRFMIQFGQYKGQTFKWLLENDVGYTAYIVAGHQKQREPTMYQSPLMANQDSLTQYASAYCELKKEVRFHRGYNRSLQSGQEGKALVGFGLHRLDTLQDLYESKDPNKISYVSFLRTKKSTCDPGSKMEDAIRYILKRDQRRGAAATRRPTPSFAPRAARKHTRDQPTTASRPIVRKQKRSLTGKSFRPR
ncbi:uncharacterized protein LOC123968937 [Micropterus dolomieu]|uniref:uncharacterized protein LOC123968937 n=1 Tax=Micropterus dolomieu TaxID=147949 RepID=UPI001E8D7DDF|nr:uncharacterized protein LOC123968937 [Micropterus dolomieu]